MRQNSWWRDCHRSQSLSRSCCLCSLGFAGRRRRISSLRKGRTWGLECCRVPFKQYNQMATLANQKNNLMSQSVFSWAESQSDPISIFQLTNSLCRSSMLWLLLISSVKARLQSFSAFLFTTRKYWESYSVWSLRVAVRMMILLVLLSISVGCFRYSDGKMRFSGRKYLARSNLLSRQSATSGSSVVYSTRCTRLVCRSASKKAMLLFFCSSLTLQYVTPLPSILSPAKTSRARPVLSTLSQMYRSFLLPETLTKMSSGSMAMMILLQSILLFSLSRRLVSRLLLWCLLNFAKPARTNTARIMGSAMGTSMLGDYYIMPKQSQQQQQSIVHRWLFAKEICLPHKNSPDLLDYWSMIIKNAHRGA